MKKVLLNMALGLFAFQSFSQVKVVVPGNNPSDIRWRYIDSRAVKVIFPEGNEKQAMRVANIINFIHDSAAVTVGDKRKHLDLLIQTNQVISNGYVALAPYRSEYYATPFQNFNQLGSVQWLDVLSFHEYRHALQFANSRRGLTKFGYIIGGQGLWALMANVVIPNWYLEGDAVQTETLLSRAGRGRTPFYFQEQKALLYNNKHYSYMKARNGSFRSQMPDHYRLGYAMLHQVRHEYGPDTWKKVLARGAGFRGLIYSFSHALKHETGFSTRRMYYKVYDTLKTQWEHDLKNVTLIPTTTVTPRPKRVVTYYKWANQMEDGSVVCIKSSYNEISRLVRIKDGKEERLTTMGTVTEPFLSVNNNKAAWTVYRTNSRWLNRNYNDIVCYDLVSGKRTKITTASKLFSPQFSRSGDKIVAVKADETLMNKIVIVNAANGAEVDSIPNPENDFMAYPKWSRDDKSIIFVAKRVSEIAILKYDFESKKTTELTPWSHHVIEATSVGTNEVYYTASYSGINNVYAVSLAGDKQVKQVSSVKIGANMPNISPDDKTLVMSEFDVMGEQLTKQNVDLASANAISFREPEEMNDIFRIETTAVEHDITRNRIPQNTFEVKKYKGAFRGAKLHTWGLSSSLSNLGVSLQVDNILNDMQLRITGGYNRNEKAYNFSAALDYARFYIPFSIGAIANQRSTEIYQNPLITDGDSITRLGIKYQETIINAEFVLPQTWVHGAYTTKLRLSASPQQIMTSDYKNQDTSFNKNAFNFTGVAAELNLSNLRQLAHQHFLPRFGQQISVSLNQSVSSSDALRYMASGILYFPGIGKTHSLNFSGRWKREQRTNNYIYLDNFEHARGYDVIMGDEEFVLSANYQLPIVYPDFGFLGMAYFKRVRLNLFGDYAQVKREIVNQTISQNSVGFELMFDINVIQILPISFGYRTSYLLDKDYYNSGKTNFSQFFLAGTF
jgi:hypothetical protein